MSKIREKFNRYVEAKNQIVCVTCYDASFSKILDDLKIDIVLVGDSLGMVIKGDENTHSVKKDEILYIPKSKIGLKLSKDNVGLKLLMQVRDETHRFAVNFQRSKRRI